MMSNPCISVSAKSMPDKSLKKKIPFEFKVIRQLHSYTNTLYKMNKYFEIKYFIHYIFYFVTFVVSVGANSTKLRS